MFRGIVEHICGPVTDEDFKDALDMATEDIKVNRIREGKPTNILYVIYAICVSSEIIRRIFIPWQNEILYGKPDAIEPKGILTLPSEVSTDAEALRTPKAGVAGEDLALKSRGECSE